MCSSDLADIQRANISAEATKSLYGAGGKGTDEQRTVNDVLETMKADKKSYPQLRGANGEPDILKVRQAASIASGTNKQTPVVTGAETSRLYSEWAKLQADPLNKNKMSFNQFISQYPNAAHMLTSQDQDINTLVSRYLQ